MYASALALIDLNAATWRSMSRWTLIALVGHALIALQPLCCFIRRRLKHPKFSMSPCCLWHPRPPSRRLRHLRPKPQPVVKKSQPKPTPQIKPAPTDSKTCNQPASNRHRRRPPTKCKALQPHRAAQTSQAPQSPTSQPQFDAAYLNNPQATAYPRMSTRLGEEGRVEVEVQVQADGLPSKVSLKRSSGYLTP